MNNIDADRFFCHPGVRKQLNAFFSGLYDLYPSIQAENYMKKQLAQLSQNPGPLDQLLTRRSVIQECMTKNGEVREKIQAVLFKRWSRLRESIWGKLTLIEAPLYAALDKLGAFNDQKLKDQIERGAYLDVQAFQKPEEYPDLVQFRRLYQGKNMTPLQVEKMIEDNINFLTRKLLERQGLR